MQREAIFTVIKQQMEEIIDDVDIKSIDESKSMADYGADSLEIVEVVSRSMKELNLRVRRTSLSEAKHWATWWISLRKHLKKAQKRLVN